MYSCAPEKATQSYGRWTVKGCGYTAKIRCYPNHDDGLMDRHLYGDTNCVLIRSMPESSQSSKKVERLHVHETEEGHDRLVLTLVPENHQWVVAAIPGQYPDRIAVQIGFEQNLPETTEPCEVILVADGEKVEGVAAVKANEDRSAVKFSLTLEALRKIAQSERLVGQICEQNIKIDQPHIELLREFELEFRERLILPSASGNKTD